MQGFRERLSTLGSVACFDYPYQLAGRRSPDRHAVLVAAHFAALTEAARRHDGAVVLVGKSMGGRIGCHVAVETSANPAALVCLGYPLVGQNGAVRDQVLHALRTPVLFVQGTRDPLCPLDRLAQARSSMTAPNELFVIEQGDHSLLLTPSALRARGVSQAEVDDGAVDAIGAFVDRHT